MMMRPAATGARGDTSDSAGVVFVLYGVAARDASELVCQFFADMEELEDFRSALPGRYEILTVSGIDYDKIEVVH